MSAHVGPGSATRRRDSRPFCDFLLGGCQKKQKADVAEHPWVFDHVGLLVNGRLEAELPLT
jgi:hypothetical protein